MGVIMYKSDSDVAYEGRKKNNIKVEPTKLPPHKQAQIQGLGLGGNNLTDKPMSLEQTTTPEAIQKTLTRQDLENLLNDI